MVTSKIFNKTLIGMLHVQALPGTPKNYLSMPEIIDFSCREAEIFVNNGIYTLIIENMHDIPYLNSKVGPEITSAMAIIAYELKKRFSLTLGIQILAGANKEALATALCSGADFIRAEGFVFSHVADEGMMNSCAGELLRYRKAMGAEHVKIITDIKKKHSAHAITADVDIRETAKAAQFFAADGVIITGASTGLSADLEELKSVKKSVDIPVLIGSGINEKNLISYLEYADGLIIGSYFKENGYWANELSLSRIKKIVAGYKDYSLGITSTT
ncbi:BtpA/SgcQ family protein [bacterium]|nr:BtpA/SgcQ family protein [bacterium]